MRAVVDVAANPFGIHEIYFDRPVPQLPCEKRRSPRRRVLRGISRSIDLGCETQAMVDLNAGRIPMELIDPNVTYRALLEDLAFGVPGLIEIASDNVYTWQFRVGYLFSALKVGRKIIRRVRKHCFPSERLKLFALNAEALQVEQNANQASVEGYG